MSKTINLFPFTCLPAGWDVQSPTNESCASCQFFKPAHSKSLSGDCRKHAPVIARSPNGDSVTRFPLVQQDAFCGDYRAKETKRESRAKITIPKELMDGKGCYSRAGEVYLVVSHKEAWGVLSDRNRKVAAFAEEYTADEGGESQRSKNKSESPEFS